MTFGGLWGHNEGNLIFLFMKTFLIIGVVLLLIVGGGFLMSRSSNPQVQGVFDRLTRGVLPEEAPVRTVELTGEEKILLSIDKANPAVATIHTGVGASPSLKELSDKFIARAVVLSDDGYLATATAAFDLERAQLGQFSVLLPGIGEPHVVVEQQAYGPVTILRIDAEPKQVVQIGGNLSAGASIVALGGDAIMSPAIGRVLVSAIPDVVQTDLTQKFAFGTPLFDDSGALVGFYASASDSSESVFFASSLIQEAFSQSQ